MPFNPDRTKQAQEAIFSRKTHKSVHPPLFINNAYVTLTHTLKPLDLQLQSLPKIVAETSVLLGKYVKVPPPPNIKVVLVCA